MTTRPVAREVPASGLQEGAGVQVYRTLGTPACRNLDPFLMLDRFESSDPADYLAGFPDHPHRGFCTFTYMLDGRMRHHDSMGNEGLLGPGGAQWMKAGSGIIHSEMPEQEAGLMRGFQLWINLPASEKMTPPDYQDVAPESVPEVVLEGGRVRVLIGPFTAPEGGEVRGPISDPHTDTRYLDVALEPNGRFAQPLPAGHNALIFLFEGAGRIADTPVDGDGLVVLGDGDTVTVEAEGSGARFILVAGRPLGEPVVQHGPFVMDTEAGIHEAFNDFRQGRLVREKAALHTN
ncbi:MAG: pirin family protein [Pseudomonadota bacterium]